MKYKKPKIIDSNLLFLTWWLLNKEGHTREAKSENFFRFLGFLDDNLDKKFPSYVVSQYLLDLCNRYGVIEQFFIHVYDENTSDTEPVRSKAFNRNFRNSELPLALVSPSLLKPEEFVDFSINLDENAAQDFINYYLESWLHDELYLNKANLLKCEKQIKKIADKIFDLLIQHHRKNLWLEESSLWDDVDYVAVLLVFEKLKFVKIKEVQATALKRFKFRIDLEDLFFKFFENQEFLGAQFDFSQLKTSNVKPIKQIEKSPLVIEYDYLSRRLFYQDEELHKMNEGCGPLEILKKVFSGPSPSYEIQFTGDSKEREKLQGMITNLRKVLRPKLKAKKVPKDIVKNEKFLRLDGQKILVSKIFVLKTPTK